MTEADLRAEIDGAEAYEGLHVPALFGQWTALVLDEAGVEAGHAVLDVACGTGVLARAAEERVGASGSVTGIDPNPGMLAVAGRLSSAVTWTPGRAEALPATDGSFDRAVSQFGLMFFVDRKAAVMEMLRVLEPGGRLAIAVWDSLDNTPAYARMVGLLDRMAGSKAAEALTAPFVLGDRTAVEDLLVAAGCVDVRGTTVVGKGRFPSLHSMVEADLRGWLPVMGVHLEEEVIRAILAESETVLAEFVRPDGRVEFDAPAHIVSGQRARV